MMISQASIIAVLMISCSALVHAQTLENLSSDSDLTLFVSAEEQKTLEQSQSEMVLSGSEEVLSETSNGSDEANRDLDEIVVPNAESKAEAIDRTDHVISSIRYDGIVMKGDQVLGAWFDGSRVTDIEGYTSADTSEISSGGQLKLVKGADMVTLYPGDYYSPDGAAVGTPVALAPEHQAEQIAEANDSESGVAEFESGNTIDSDVSDTGQIDPDQNDPGQLDLDQVEAGQIDVS